MAQLNLMPNLPQFDAYSEPSSIATRWKEWLEQFEIFTIAAKVEDKKQKRALLLHISGPTVQKVFKGLTDTGDDYDTAAAKLNEYFAPKKHIRYERYHFKQACQQDGESIDQFASRLRNLAETCEFENIDDVIADQILANCSSNRLKEKILREEKADLTFILKQGRILECSKQQAARIGTNSPTTPEISAIQATPANRPLTSNDHRQQPRGYCRNCGETWPHVPSKPCPAFGKSCRSCGKQNHFARVCRSRPQNRNTQRQGQQRPRREQLNQISEDIVSDDEEGYIYATNTDGEHANVISRPQLPVVINGVEIVMMIDSGASVNILDKAAYEQIVTQNDHIQLQKTSTRIYAYGAAEPLALLGKFQATIETLSSKTNGSFYVVDGFHGSILSHDTSVALGLISVPHSINTVSAQKSLPQLLEEYQDIFHGIGKLKDFQFQIYIDPDVKPVAQLPRRIPFHIRKQVEQEIESLEQQGIIEAVDGPTPWVSPVVAVPKTSNPKEIRLCVDLRQPNKAVQRQRHPTPTIEEVTNDLNGASVFSKLDLRSGYHQIELTPASRYLTTFTTHKGLRQYTRLLFGLASASEVFQQVIQQALQGIPGVKNISDDIIVFGRTQEEHDAALADTFQRLREKGLTLNGSKCVYNKQNLAFFGYVFSAKGMSADPKKIAAICDATPPTNPSEVRSFLGLTGFCSRFIPNYATLTEPLKHLTRKGVRWNWGVQQNKSFLALKECLTSNRTMAYFDPSKRTIATFDASPFGLGAVLTQVDADGQERSVAYASRTLSDVERRYSQTEREALAIVWGCERFHLYLYGSQFEIVTDHKPLETIFNNPASNPPARIQRWALRLQPYTFTVKYRPGPLNIADYLSRHPSRSQTTRERKIAEEYVNYLVGHAIPKAMTLEEVNSASKADPIFQRLRQAITTDVWPNNDPDLTPFNKVKFELTVATDSDIILRGTRVVLPKCLQLRAVKLAHESHQGIVKTKQLLREKVWYPGIDKDVKTEIDDCIPCQATSQNVTPEPLQMTTLPTAPWSQVSTDFCGPFPSGDYLLVVIDDYSRYPEVEVLRSTSAEATIPKLDRIFATHGIPDVMKSDNGPPFSGHEFAKYAKEKGFQHRRITPLWPAANGEAERFYAYTKQSHQNKLNRRKELEERSTTVSPAVPSYAALDYREVAGGAFVWKKGTLVTVQKTDGSTLSRNSSHLKKVTKRAAEQWANIPNDSGEDDDDDDDGSNENNVELQNAGQEQRGQNQRPARERRRPNYLGDYVMY
ncbi:uncharacterized protein K02A2.6-like [Dendronephthya gigantea]|uniref:uncharacterized protein K02A2.6-like n=1 Tax=Dendronephthya gigantea TaxID=151771 RepID=UPI00106A9175|nr:uncharacterized protein K02A2.6-like [Dendronephthya gigantea]